MSMVAELQEEVEKLRSIWNAKRERENGCAKLWCLLNKKRHQEFPNKKGMQYQSLSRHKAEATKM